MIRQFTRRAYAWSEKADSCLLFLRNKGKSFSNIAKVLGVRSRGVVIRRYHTLVPTAKKATPTFNEKLWTTNEDGILRVLWAKGLTARQIAIAIGRTRNAVLGRADRLDLPARAVARSAKPGAGRLKPLVPLKVRRQQAAYFKDFKRALAVMEKAVLGPGVHLTELEPHHCRFISGDPTKMNAGVFCGREKQKGSSYCPDHHKICFRRG